VYCNAIIDDFTVYFNPVAQQPFVGQGFLVIEASSAHSDTPHSSGRVIGP
jgi:hypothetical protein